MFWAPRLLPVLAIDQTDVHPLSNQVEQILAREFDEARAKKDVIMDVVDAECQVGQLDFGEVRFKLHPRGMVTGRGSAGILHKGAGGEFLLYWGKMLGAMDRFLTVNDSSSSSERRRPRELDPSDAADSPDWADPLSSLVESGASGTQGPCLYLGSQGQRCLRPALIGGFCQRHQSGSETAKPGSRGVTRMAAAGIGILAALWPIVFDILRIIVRWIHAHG
jgi:hypothetical protein